MSRTVRNSAVLDTPVRDGSQTRGTRRPGAPIRRQGTRAAVIAAALADYATEA